MAFYPKRNKFSNQRSLCDLNHSHRSKLESSVCQILQLREKAGEIKILRAECPVHLTKAKILYIADFECLNLRINEEFYVEAKGFQTPEWKIKKRLWVFYGPKVLEIWTGGHSNPKLTEIITPVPCELDS